ncbi:MAG: acyl dehydratase [Solirubrobacteraceae bacterium]|nr:acyl dehydratase [Solirubrobacteraceae bacterium]
MPESVDPVTTVTVAGPHFDDLAVGDVLDAAPTQTLTPGVAAAHQAILGGRWRLSLDAPLADAVLGHGDGALASPALVCDVAIGQSTGFTQRVRANLFYRGLVLHRPVRIGDTLRTVTRVEALRENRRREGREPTGLVVLRITTVDQEDRPVLDFRRCAMLPLSPGAAPTGHADDLDRFSGDLDGDALRAAASGFDLAAYRAALPTARHLGGVADGTVFDVQGGDVVTSAPELARLSLNVAAVHHDAAAAGGRRLVYGGHTIGLAAAQITRALPDLVTVVAWEGCDHVGPVHEGDTLHGTVEVVGREPTADGGALVRLRSRVRARRADGTDDDVLDWRLVALSA